MKNRFEKKKKGRLQIGTAETKLLVLKITTSACNVRQSPFFKKEPIQRGIIFIFTFYRWPH